MASPPHCRVSGVWYLNAVGDLVLLPLLAFYTWCSCSMQVGILHCLPQFLQRNRRRPSRTETRGQACCIQNGFVSGLKSALVQSFQVECICEHCKSVQVDC